MLKAWFSKKKKRHGFHVVVSQSSVGSNSLWPHGWQYTRLPFPSPSPGACSNSCPLSRWCHPTISSSVTHFSSYLQSFPASGSFPMSWLFASGGQSIGTSASASILPMKIQGWFSLGLTGLLSLQSKGVSRAHFKSINSLVVSLLCGPYMTTGKTIALTRRTFSTKWCLCFLICYLGWS